MPTLPPNWERWNPAERLHWIRQAMGTVILDLYDHIAERQGKRPSTEERKAFLVRVNGVIDRALRWREEC